MFKKKYKTGLVLSGGSARGFAHLGVLKALKEHNIHPDAISGVSAGAIAGAFYADGHEPEEILEMFIEKRLFQLVRFTLPKHGFFKMTGIYDLLRSYLKAKYFSDLKLPLTIAATNLNKGSVTYFDSGLLEEKIVASATIPIMFKPRIIDNQTYVDGGVYDNLPVKPLYGKCKKIIGVSLNPQYEEKNIKSMMKVVERTFYLNLSSNIRSSMQYCDMFIEPQEIKNYGLFEVSKAREIFDVGYNAAMKTLESSK